MPGKNLRKRRSKRGRRVQLNEVIDFGPGIELNNIVSTCKISRLCKFKRSGVAKHKFPSEYRVDFHQESGSTLIFKTKQTVTVGSQDLLDVMVNMQRLTRFASLKNNGRLISMGDCMIRNFVCKGSAPHPVKLDVFANTYSESVTYDPDSFPGARGQYMLPNGKHCAINLFASGQFIILGQTHEADIIAAKELIIAKLEAIRDKVYIHAEPHSCPKTTSVEISELLDDLDIME